METKVKGTKLSTKLNAMKKKSVMELIETVVELTADRKLETSMVALELKELGERFGITPMEALFLAVFVDQSDDTRIYYRDISRHFNCRSISIMAKDSSLETLIQKGFIKRRSDDGKVVFRMPATALEAVKKGEMPPIPKMDGLDINEWLDIVFELLETRDREEINDNDLYAAIHELIEKNQQLIVAQKLKGFALDNTDLVLFLVMSMLFIQNNDDRICGGDIDDYFKRSDYCSHRRELMEGNHLLMSAKLVEHSTVEGQVEPSCWQLTNYAKQEVWVELHLKTSCSIRTNLTHPNEIVEKALFYPEKVEKQVAQLANLLEEEKMERVLKRLEKKGMRKGFTCIFYGGPGTGKTETALQLARKTKRDIMLVDIPSIRSKWVGEMEKNIKAVFERYRKAVESCGEGVPAPILLFNEADALLNKRNEDSTHCVDKAENSMQNIILQEMENLTGIMIATTNLTGSLDSAFERRFLFKIEFERPTAKERCRIWKSLIPELNDKDAYTLADRFEFSGGEIENIARKRIIDDILSERDEVDLDAIIENCKNEQFSKRAGKNRIGF